MKRTGRWAWLVSILVMVAAAPASAQSGDEIKLSLSRDFGYGGFGQVQGLFSMKASGPEGLERVAFQIDGQVIAEDTEAPFKVQFHTDSYAPGIRLLTAVGYTADGRTLHSNEIRIEFLSKEAAGQATRKVILPIVGLVGLILVAMVVATLVASRRRGKVPLGQPRKYGAFGGSICPKCGRPFALSFLGLNVGLGKLTACPHCGKWSVVRRVPLEALRAAEEVELAGSQGTVEMEGAGKEEELRKAIDDSRYQDI
jgi:hypothetical protein